MNSSYKVSQVLVQNFKCIESGEFLFEGKNLVVLDGPNGYGKTTLFDAIEIILTGKPRRIRDNHNILATYSYNDSPIHRDSTKPIVLELQLKDDNEDLIVLSRKFDSAPDQKSIRNNPQKIYQESKLEIFQNGEKLETSVQDLFKFSKMDLFGVLNYVEQDENTFFLKKNPKEKYKDLAILLGVEQQIGQLQLFTQFLKKLGQKIGDYEQEIRQIEEDNKNLITKKSRPEYKRLLDNVDVIWDTEKLEVGQIDTKISFLNELDRVDYLRQNQDTVDTVKSIIKFNSFVNDESFLNELRRFFWFIRNIEIVETEFNRRRYIDKVLKGNITLIDAIEKYEYDELSKQDTLDKFSEISELKGRIEEYKVIIGLIKTLIESLSTENRILEELKNRRNSLVQFTEQFSNLISLNDSECPTCGYDWESNEELLRQIEITEVKIFESYNKSNAKLEEEKEKLYKTFLEVLKSNLQKENDRLNKERSTLITEEFYQLIKSKQLSLNSKIEDLLSLLSEKTRVELVSIIDKRGIEEDLVGELVKIIESDIPELDSTINLSQIESDFKRYFGDDKNALSKITELSIDQKKDYIEYQYFNSVNKKIGYLNKKLEGLKTIEEKVESIRVILDKKIKTYVENIIKTISVPFYIYTGKILQEHSLGSGLIFDADINNTEPQIKIRPLNREQEASYTLSSGQLSATVISLMLVLNKVYNTSNFGTILIDDPIQTLDEINTHSLIEVLKFNFSDQQVVLSTHEDRYSKFIRYKYEKFGLSSKNINMKDLYN